MNAPFARQSVADAPTQAPEFQHSSPFDWGVLLYGGTDPRTGFAQPPLEFQFFGKSYTRRQIEAKAADLAVCHKRDHWKVQAPARKLARAA